MGQETAREISGDQTDADTFACARNALDHVPDLSSTVRVHVRHGVVTLTGSVRLPAARAAADDAVRHLPGVQRVDNRIVVTPPVIDAEAFDPERR